MDIVFLIFALILLFAGLAGCFLPVLPGPPVSFLALLLVHYTDYADFSVQFLWLMALMAVAVTIIDFLVPVWGTGRFGGSKYGMWGAAIGMVVGIFFFPPLGLLLGPLAGAVIGELLSGRNGRQAVVAGLGSFAGFLLGVGLKLAASVTITIYFIREVFFSFPAL